ncbi:hypothetical protein ACIQGZ_29445 [Streptomyces sp. NPDC092296]|uniref:hypothetical protein n=1 Tax=Streptomyces sp. NPDC092296 TaxID=3366012 RepID=UPI00380EF408
MIELAYRLDGILDGQDTPRLRQKLATADLYDLTCEMFWGELTFRVGDADFSGPGPVLDAAYVLFCTALHLKEPGKRRYSAAEGAGEYLLSRKGDVVRVREERGPSGTVAYPEFRRATTVFLGGLLDDLCGRYPELARNREIVEIRRRVGRGLPE